MTSGSQPMQVDAEPCRCAIDRPFDRADGVSDPYAKYIAHELTLRHAPDRPAGTVASAQVDRQPESVLARVRCRGGGCDLRAGAEGTQLDDPIVLAKQSVAVALCARASDYKGKIGGKPWRHALIPHDAIAENNTLQELVARFGS